MDTFPLCCYSAFDFNAKWIFGRINFVGYEVGTFVAAQITDIKGHLCLKKFATIVQRSAFMFNKCNFEKNTELVFMVLLK
jgi:hypothetical protein